MLNLSLLHKQSTWVLTIVLLLGGVAQGFAETSLPNCLTPMAKECLCQSDQKTEGCACAQCIGGKECACIVELQKQSGSLTGTVKNRWMKKFQTLVYVENLEGHEFTPPSEPGIMDQRRKEFIPHVLPIVRGTTVDFFNNDSFAHNVFTPDGEKYDLGKWGQGDKRSYTFEKTGVYVQLCMLHPEMVGFVVSLQNPYFAFVDGETGKFELSGIPPGKWKIQIWNERLKPKQAKKTFEVIIEAGQTTTVDLELK